MKPADKQKKIDTDRYKAQIKPDSLLPGQSDLEPSSGTYLWQW
jgi:hypothetical protein